MEPGLVDALSTSQISSLLGRFRFRQDHARISALARALLESGWSRGSADDRSFLASHLILDDLRQGRAGEAAKWLPTIHDPQRLYAMLADKRFAPLWPAIEQASGPRLELRWRDYLTRTRDAWSADGDEDDAMAFASALQRAGLDRSLVEQFQPRFTRGYNCPNDPTARAIARHLIGSLIELGQVAKADSVMQRLAGPRGSIEANYLSYLYIVTDRHAEAAKLIGQMLPVMAKAKKPVDERQMILARARLACANHKRGAAVEPVATDALGLTARLWTARCLDQPEEAKRLLLAALEREDDRAEALMWIQPDADLPPASAFSKAMYAVHEALRRDPEVIAAVSRYGVMHAWKTTAGVPTDLAPAKPKRPPPCGTLRDEPDEPAEVEEMIGVRRSMP